MKTGKDEIEKKLGQYLKKEKESQVIKGKITRAFPIVEKMIKDKKNEVGSLN